MKPIDECKADNLIAKLHPPVIVQAGTLAEAARLERGTLMTQDAESGKWSVVSESKTPGAVVATTMKEEGTVAELYVSGHFYRSGLLPEDFELTDAHRAALRKDNIYVCDDVEAVPPEAD